MAKTADFEMAIDTTHPFDLWFRQKLIEITGVDFSKFGPSMLPEPLLKYGY